MNKEEKDVIDFLRVSAITKIEKTIISREDVKHLLNYIDKLKKDLENLKEVERQICCEELITKDKYQDILKENEKLKIGITGIEISRDTLVEDIKELKKNINKALEYIEENSFEDTTGVVLNLKDESYWELWKLLKDN